MLKKLFLPIIVVFSFMFSVLPASAINRSLIPKWQKVDICEAKATGGWKSWSYEYPDGLGITRANYIGFGGHPGTIQHPIRSNRFVQIQIAMRFIAYYHMNIPDQYGCSGSY